MSAIDRHGNTPAMSADPLETAANWLETEPAVALATVARTWGSSPVPAGGQMVIAAEDRFAGSVSGGCIEAEVITAALDVIRDGVPRRMDFGVANETAWRAGLPCGGNVSVMVSRLKRAEAGDLLSRILAARQQRQRIVVLTDVVSGAMEVLGEHDALSTAEAEWFAREAIDFIARPMGEVFVHAIAPPPRVIVVGAAHIAQHLVAALDQLRYEAIVVDPRTAFATPERFPRTRIVSSWPAEALGSIGIDRHTAVVALAHVPDIDDPALAAALGSEAFYVGALGSTRNHARRRDRLLATGLAPDLIDRIHAPAGLDIGALTPAEIALSIAAEIVLRRRGPRRTA